MLVKLLVIASDPADRAVTSKPLSLLAYETAFISFLSLLSFSPSVDSHFELYHSFMEHVQYADLLPHTESYCDCVLTITACCFPQVLLISSHLSLKATLMVSSKKKKKKSQFSSFYDPQSQRYSGTYASFPASETTERTPVDFYMFLTDIILQTQVSHSLNNYGARKRLILPLCPFLLIVEKMDQSFSFQSIIYHPADQDKLLGDLPPISLLSVSSSVGFFNKTTLCSLFLLAALFPTLYSMISSRCRH